MLDKIKAIYKEEIKGMTKTEIQESYLFAICVHELELEFNCNMVVLGVRDNHYEIVLADEISDRCFTLEKHKIDENTLENIILRYKEIIIAFKSLENLQN